MAVLVRVSDERRGRLAFIAVTLHDFIFARRGHESAERKEGDND